MSSPDRTIPQRELRNDIGKVLREVGSGKTIRITVDGRPVADLSPVADRRVGVPWAEIVRMVEQTPVDPGYGRDASIDEPITSEDPWQPTSR